MLETQPLRTPGVRLGLLMISGLIVADVIFLFFILTLPFSFLSFILGFLFLLTLPVLVVLVLGTRSVRYGRYHVDADILHLELGQVHEQIPLSSIEGIISGQEVELEDGFRGWRWPGLYLGRGFVKVDQTSRETSFLATRPIAGQQLLLTSKRVYGISPADPALFRDSLQALMVGSLPTLPSATEPNWGILGWLIWRDRLFLGLSLANLTLNMVLFAYLAAIYGSLPDSVPLHFDALGQVDRFGSPANLLLLPLLGFLFGTINAGLGLVFYNIRDNRPVAYLIWIAAVIMQISTWVALLGLLNAL